MTPRLRLLSSCNQELTRPRHPKVAPNQNVGAHPTFVHSGTYWSVLELHPRLTMHLNEAHLPCTEGDLERMCVALASGKSTSSEKMGVCIGTIEEMSPSKSAFVLSLE